MVHNILYEKYYFTPCSIYYWRTIDKAEVDFVVKKGNDLFPVEVKFSSFNKPVLPRSFHNFIERYNPGKAFLVSRGYSDEIRIKNTTVKFIPFYQFMFSI